MQAKRAVAQFLRIDSGRRRHFGGLVLGARQELVQRRVEQPDRHRQTVHDPEELDEIPALHRQQLGERGAAAGFVVGEDHFAHRENAVGVEKHVLGAAEPDALGSEGARGLGVARRFRVGAHAEPPRLVGPAHQPRKAAGHLGLDSRDFSRHHLAGAAVDGDPVSRRECPPVGKHHLVFRVDPHRPGAGHAGPPHAARNHRRMARHAAPRREDTARRMHSVNVLGTGLATHQDDRLPFRGRLLGGIGGKDDPAGGRAGRGRQAARDHVAVGIGIERRMQQLLQSSRLDPHDCLFRPDGPLVHEVDSDLQRGLGGALPRAGLEHPQLPGLDRELDVLHVAEMVLQPVAHLDEPGERFRHGPLHRGQLRAPGLRIGNRQALRRADAGHHILALGVDQIFPVKRILAGGGVAGEGDARGAVLAHIAEHHGLHIDARAPLLGNAMQAAIGPRPRRLPAPHHRAYGLPKLGAWLLREGHTGLREHDLLEADDQSAPVVGIELGIRIHALLVLQDLDFFL